MICDKCHQDMEDTVTIEEFVVCYECALREDFAGFALDSRRTEKRRAESVRARVEKMNRKGRPEVDHPGWMTATEALSIAGEIEEMCERNLKRMGAGSHVAGFYEFGSDSAHHRVSIVFKSDSHRVVITASRSSLRHRLYVKSCESLAAKLSSEA
ncbi:MAG: hypothetical protein GIW99_00130 [Candidatus Eremiobacteraeota bacterium]|nr:hypothetical protein [Candidatus Eremiobacteraeota bacterium]MBC5826094.1 hypothetical protein [Candidatus Eremiobacteraeota bacterium]